MMKRINKHLNQRSEMLSGISHDLRTPLTRLKLQLAMLSQKDLSEKMSKDIDEMEKMLNDYLQFARTQSLEETSSVDINNIFVDIKNNLNNQNFEFTSKESIIFKGRPMALKRSFENIIQNGLIYGKKVLVKAQKTSNRVVLTFDGPQVHTKFPRGADDPSGRNFVTTIDDFSFGEKLFVQAFASTGIDPVQRVGEIKSFP